MILFIFSALLASTNAAYVISVYGDVQKDVHFFTRTFPWIIDNIGGEITVEYYIMGSGRYSVPQMCALEELKNNTYVQAQFLKCEADGNPSEYCLCDAGIDPKTFKECVAARGSLASLASAKFSELGIDLTPIIELEPWNTVYGVEDMSYLKKICTIFGDKLPRGCVKPHDSSESFLEKKSLAQFDRACHKEFPISGDDDRPVSPMPTTITPPWWWSTTPRTTRGTSPLYSTTLPPWWFTTTQRYERE